MHLYKNVLKTTNIYIIYRTNYRNQRTKNYRKKIKSSLNGFKSLFDIDGETVNQTQGQNDPI